MATRSEQRREIDRARVARVAARELEEFLRSGDPNADVKVMLEGERRVLVPRRALELLAEALDALGDGQDPSVLPMAKELSTADVASLLGVSRQYVARLLDQGKIPFRRVGNRRRILVGDALAYLREDKRRRVERLGDLAAG